MKKIFLPLLFCLTIIFSSASAQDIYGSSKYGYDYYVMTETINERDYTTNVNGENYPVKEVTVNVKKIRGNDLIKIQHWKFTSFNYRTWQFVIDDTESGSFSTMKTLYAQEIFEVMKPYISSYK